jgi:hypothetical protein
MSKETFYFSHDYNARTDRKLVNVIMKHGMTGIGTYWCLIEMLYEEGGYLPLEYERITFELRTEINVIQDVIDNFELFKNDGVKFWSNAVLERLKKRQDKSVKARESINQRWGKYERNTNVIQSNKKRNTIKESKGKENKEYSSVEAEEKISSMNGYITPKLFETFWKLYPKKIDKGKALSSWNKICTRKNITPPLWKELRIALHHQKQSERWKDKTFIPHPTTWLNQSRWLDDPLEMKNFGDRDKENFKCLFGGKFGEGFNPSVERCRNCEEDESKLYRRCRLEFSQLKQLKA